MKRKWNDTVLIIVFIVVLVFLGISLLINTGKSCDTEINFITFDEVNATDAIIYFAKCNEMCSTEFPGSYQKLESCYDQCNMMVK